MKNIYIIASIFSFSFWLVDMILPKAPTPKEEIAKVVHPDWLCHAGPSDYFCIEEILAEQKRIKMNSYSRHALTATGEKIKIPVYAHRFQSTCVFDEYSTTEAKINAEISYTNFVYSVYDFNVELVLIDIFEHTSDSAHTGGYTDFLNLFPCEKTGYIGDEYDESFMNRYGIQGAINLFCVRGDTDQHANFPTDPIAITRNMIVLKFYNDGWSTLHELGHTFNLFHTFTTVNGFENVTRDPNDPPCYNAETAGDLVADTPAAKELGFLANDLTLPVDGCDEQHDCTCALVWNNAPPVDQCNNPFELNEGIWGNLMQYGSRDCARSFTQGQIDRMWDGLLLKISNGDFDFCLLPGTGNCPSTALLQGIVDLGQVVTTSTSIDATQTINNGTQKHTFESKEVNLKPGFEIFSGAKLDIKPIPCDCN